jgi:Fic family protein
MTPDWDDDSPELRRNLTTLLQSVERDARQRKQLTVEAARGWQREMMHGLTADPKYIGAFRGEPGLQRVQVHVGGLYGVASHEVADALRQFERRLQAAVAYLDELIPPAAEPDAEQSDAIVEVCAWAHAEWLRIHPLANGNGRTARLWANSLAMRYNLPSFVRLRPRPDGGYDFVSQRAMLGDWEPTAILFREMLDGFSDEPDA